MKIRRLLATAGITTITAAGLLGLTAGVASAHDHTVNATCDALDVSLSRYWTDGTHTNTVKVVVDGATVADTTFDETYTLDVPSHDRTAGYAWSVTVVAWDDPAFNVDESGTVAGCPAPPAPPRQIPPPPAPPVVPPVAPPAPPVHAVPHTTG